MIRTACKQDVEFYSAWLSDYVAMKIFGRVAESKKKDVKIVTTILTSKKFFQLSEES